MERRPLTFLSSRLQELNLKRKKARQATAKREAAKFQQKEKERIKHKDAEDARIRNEDAIALTQERALELQGSTANAKRIMKVGRRAISAKGMYLGDTQAPMMKLKIKDKEGGQKTLEIRALTGKKKERRRNCQRCTHLYFSFQATTQWTAMEWNV